MLTIYCTACGSKHEYTLPKPRFCQNCANPFGGAAADVRQPTPKQSAAKRTTDNADEEDMDREVPALDKIEIDIQIPKTHGFKLDEIRSTKIDFKRDAVKGKSAEEIMSEYDELFKKDREIKDE